MDFREYVMLMEGEERVIENKLLDLINDLKEAKGDEEEIKSIIKGIFRYITNNVVKVGRANSDKLIDKDVAEKLEKVIAIAEKKGIEVPGAVEDKIKESVHGKVDREEEEEETPKKKSKKVEVDDEIEQERKEKEAKDLAEKKKKEEEDAADKELADEKVKDKAASGKKDENIRGVRHKALKDDELEAYLSRVTRRK